MRLFRKKSNSSDNQEYLDGLISSIKQARREDEEKSGLHSFVEADYFPGGPSGPPKVPPGVAKAGGVAPDTSEVSESDAVADLEAYLSTLDAAKANSEDGRDDQEERPA